MRRIGDKVRIKASGLTGVIVKIDGYAYLVEYEAPGGRMLRRLFITEELSDQHDEVLAEAAAQNKVAGESTMPELEHEDS